MFQKVLVATDGSGPAGRAVKWAAEVAALADASLVIVHTVMRDKVPAGWRRMVEAEHLAEIDNIQTIDPASVPTGFLQLQNTRGQRVIIDYRIARAVADEILRRAGDRAHQLGVKKVKTVAATGEPADDILKTAKKEKVDLIVMGSRGLGGVKSAIMGSVSTKIGHNADTDCVIVKQCIPTESLRSAAAAAWYGAWARRMNGMAAPAGAVSATGFDAVVFDLDGVLIDSEPLWRLAEKRAFRVVDIELTDAMCIQTMGMRMDQVIDYWHGRYPWQTPDKAEMHRLIVDQVARLITARGIAMPGVRQALASCAECGLKLAIASSSPSELIDRVLDVLDLGHYFEVRCSAGEEAAGKPDPAVYLSAARKLQVAPAACIAVEDSVTGLKAARASGMYSVVVPDRANRGHPDFHLADVRLESLEGFPHAVLAP